MMSGKRFAFGDVHRFLSGLFAEDVHAKRVYSLANATLGVMSAASLAVNAIGHGLALARGGLTKHAIKSRRATLVRQVDRLLSNLGIDVDALMARWVRYVVGARPRIAVAMDWTDFDADGQSLPSRRRGRRSCLGELRSSACRCSAGMAGRRRWSG